MVLGERGVVSGARVVLHRVTAEEAGEIDSVGVGADGSFEFAIERATELGPGEEVLFASAHHEGVLYFGAAVTDASHLDSLYVITVFDSDPVPPEGARLPVGNRNLFLDPWAEGWRAIDLLQILNEGARTLVATEGGVVWSYPLPPDATSLQLGQGELPNDAVTFDDGRLTVRSPLPPGERSFSVEYVLPGLEARIPVPGRTDRFNLFVREPVPPLDVAGLETIDVVALDSERNYRRYSGIDLRDALVSLEEGTPSGPPPLGIFALALGTLLGAAALLAYLRPRRRAVASAAPPGPGREGLILAVVRLDEALEATRDAERRRALSGERARLVARLRALG